MSLTLIGLSSGGPLIPFRGGRVTATQAGPPGVPQPQEPLASHTAAFARMGFTPTEMIQLVACGHTIGGVQHAAFPDVVPKKVVNKKKNPDGNMIFDQTFAAFDNHMYAPGCTHARRGADRYTPARWRTCPGRRSTRSWSART
jgi:catalase (peroxidase I)